MTDAPSHGRLTCTRCGEPTPAHLVVVTDAEIVCYDCRLYLYVPQYVHFQGQCCTYQRAECYETFTAPVEQGRWWDFAGGGNDDGYHLNATRLPRTGRDVLDMHMPPLSAQMGIE